MNFSTISAIFSGPQSWPPGCCLRYLQGEKMSLTEFIIVEALDSGGSTEVSVQMTSPMLTGIYQSQWRMQTATGLFFGGFILQKISSKTSTCTVCFPFFCLEVIWLILQVEESGVLGLTQQLNNISNFDTRPSTSPRQQNPFAFGTEALQFEEKPDQSMVNPQESRSALNVASDQSQLSQGRGG